MPLLGFLGIRAQPLRWGGFLFRDADDYECMPRDISLLPRRILSMRREIPRSYFDACLQT